MTEALAQARGLPARRARAGAVVGGVGAPPPAPLVAILCASPRARVAAAGVALALARASGGACALVGAVGDDLHASIGGAPSAHRAARRVREQGLPATASGRLVWLADRRGALAPDDVAGRAAVMSAELGRAGAAVGAPAAIAVPLARTAALDRVLAWHDAIVVVREPDAPDVVIERALASLAQLGRPTAAMAPTPRLSGALAVRGLAVPVEAMRAVAALELGGVRPGSRDA